METGRLLASRNIENIVSTFYSSPRWQDDPAAKIRSLHALLAAHPAYFLTQLARNLVEHLRKDLTLLLGWPMALIPLAGILGLAIRPPTRRQMSLYLFAVAYWLFMGIVFYSPRFLPLVLPTWQSALPDTGGAWNRPGWDGGSTVAAGARSGRAACPVRACAGNRLVQVGSVVAVER